MGSCPLYISSLSELSLHELWANPKRSFQIRLGPQIVFAFILIYVLRQNPFLQARVGQGRPRDGDRNAERELVGRDDRGQAGAQPPQVSRNLQMSGSSFVK